MSDQPGTANDPKTTTALQQRYWQLWQHGAPPDLDSFLAHAGPLTPAELVAVLCVDLRERWRRQDWRRAEEYLRQFPQVRAEAEAAVDLVYCEFLLRDDRGEIPNIDEYQARFPEWASVLGRQIQMHKLLQASTTGAHLPTGLDKGPQGQANSAPGPDDFLERVRQAHLRAASELEAIRLPVTDSPSQQLLVPETRLPSRQGPFESELSSTLATSPPTAPSARETVSPVGTEPAAAAELTEEDAYSVTLAVIEGPQQGRTYIYERHDTFLVGRSPDVHFPLPNDPCISRAHFLVEVSPPLCRLLDLRSHNRTFVNGQPVQSARLKDGDEIQAGNTVLKISIRQAQQGNSPDVLSETKVLDLPANPVADGAASLLGGFRLIRELGRGGMGVVYLAQKDGAAKPVALKSIRPAVNPTRSMIARFLREVEILRELIHPHIVAFEETAEEGGLLYFAMEYVEGASAAKLARGKKPLGLGRAVRLVCQVLEALAYAHGVGFVHRDVKPANMLVAQEAGKDFVKLADFGLARAYQSSPLSGLTVSNELGGTPAFMPPEQVLDFRSCKPTADQYAAAASLYYLLCGEHVYGHCASLDEFYQRVLTVDPVPLESRRPDVPAGLASAIHQALARRPEDRFKDVVAFRAALLPFAEG